MCQRLNTGESNNFYVGIYICIAPLNIDDSNKSEGISPEHEIWS